MIPPHHRICDPVLLYQTHINGYSLNNLLQICRKIKPIILLIKSKQDNVFGFYASKGLARTHWMYLGSRECFLFRVLPTEGRYGWQEGAPDTFLFIDDNYFYIGTGGDGSGLTIDSELHQGSSYSCQTFKNDPLNGATTIFEVSSLEAYTLKGS